MAGRFRRQLAEPASVSGQRDPVAFRLICDNQSS
jgi:hypothetical protein